MRKASSCVTLAVVPSVDDWAAVPAGENGAGR